jgi:hypothetical protein
MVHPCRRPPLRGGFCILVTVVSAGVDVPATVAHWRVPRRVLAHKCRGPPRHTTTACGHVVAEANGVLLEKINHYLVVVAL